MMVWMWYDYTYDCGVMVRKLCLWMLWMHTNRRNYKESKQKIDLNEPQKISLKFKFFCNISPNTATRGFPKISEDSRKTSSVVIWFAFVYPCVSTEDPEEQKCYFLYYYIKEIYNIKRSSGSSGTSQTYTQLNQNTGAVFLEKVSRFYASVFMVFRIMSSK